MNFLINHFLTILKASGIEYTHDVFGCNDHIIKLYNLPAELDNNLIHATYGEDDNLFNCCAPRQTKKNRYVEISINPWNFGGVLNTVSAVVNDYIHAHPVFK